MKEKKERRGLKNFGIFMLGFFMALVLLFGSVAGVGLYLYNNGTMAWYADKVGADIDDFVDDENAEVDFKNFTIKQLIADISSLQGGIQSMSLGQLEKRYGIKLAEKLNGAFPLPDAAFTVPLNKLTTQEGIDIILNNTNFDYIFRVAPDVMSDIAQRQLSSKPLSLVLSGDIAALLDGVQVGSLTNAAYDEENGRFTVADIENPTITEAMNNADLGKFYAELGGENGDVLKAISGAVGTVKLNSLFVGLENVFKSKRIDDLLVQNDSGAMAFDAFALLSGAYMGDLIGYDATMKDVEVDGEIQSVVDFWSDADGNRVNGLMQEVSNIKIDSLIDGSFNSDGMLSALGDVRIGEMMGLHFKDGVWSDDNGAPATGIIKALADITINELNGDVLKEKLSTLKLGDIVDCTDGILAALANSSLDTIDEDIKTLQLGVVLGYTFDRASGVWKDAQGNPLSGIMAELADKSVGGVAQGIDDISIGTVLGLYKKDGVWYTDKQCTVKATGIQGALANYTIGGETGISSGLNNIKIGEVMGLYKSADGKWYKDDAFTVPADGVAAAMADLTFGEFSSDKMTEVVNGLKVSDLFDTTNSDLLSLISPDTTIKQMPTALLDSLQTITTQKALDLGIIVIDNTTQSKLDDKISGWKEKSLNEFLNALIALAIA